MSTTIAQLLVKVSADTHAARKDLKETGKDVDGLGQKSDATESKLRNGLTAASKVAAVGLAALAVGAKKAVDDASDLNEATNKAGVTFGKFAGSMPGYTKSVASSLGMSRAAALDNAAGLGAMTQAMGISRGESAKMSKRMLKAAADLGSFHNADPTDMLDRLRAGLSGEAEPLKKFGILVTEARVKQEAMRLGLAKTEVDTVALTAARVKGNEAHMKAAKALREHGKGSIEYEKAASAASVIDARIKKLMKGKVGEIGNAAKVQARYSLILRDGALANDDFKNTSGGLANQQRILKAQITDVSAKLGTALLPAAQKVMTVIIGLTNWIGRNATLVKVLAGVLGGAATAILVITGAIKAWAAAQALLNVAMSANPLLLVVAALAGLTIALVAAYKSSETFRNIVNGAFGAVSKVVTTFVGFFSKTLPDAFDDVLKFARSNWPKIATILSGPFAPLVALATDAFGVRSALTGALSALLGSVGGTARRISDAIKRGFTAVFWDVPKLLYDRIIQPMIDKLVAVTAKAGEISLALVRGIKGVAWGMATILDDRIVKPIGTLIGTIAGKGADLARAFIRGVRDLGKEVWDTGLAKFRGFINSVIGFLNKIPFVNIPKLANGANITRGPQIAMIGEAGPEAVIPLSRSKKGRTAKLLAQAASIAGIEGDFAGVGGVTRMANGGIGGLGFGASTNAVEQMFRASMRSSGRSSWWEDVARFGRSKLADVVSGLPTPSDPGFLGAASYVRDAAAAFIRGAHEKAQDSQAPKLLDSLDWSRRQRGKAYVWGGGHGGWNYNLPGYDCSGGASHAAKLAGSTIGSPGTTMSLSPISRGTNDPSSLFAFGFRGMNNPDPRKQHMGWGVLGNWFQYGGGAGGGGSATWGEWNSHGIPPGVPSKMSGVGRVSRTQALLAHRGEALLSPVAADDYRRGRSGPTIAVTISGNTILSDSPETAERLARLLEPALARLVG